MRITRSEPMAARSPRTTSADISWEHRLGKRVRPEAVPKKIRLVGERGCHCHRLTPRNPHNPRAAVYSRPSRTRTTRNRDSTIDHHEGDLPRPLPHEKVPPV